MALKIEQVIKHHNKKKNKKIKLFYEKIKTANVYVEITHNDA